MEVRYLEKLMLRDLKPDDVFIEILYASVTARDPYELTQNANGFIPCSDASAVIRAVGENVKEFEVGDRVCPMFWGETGVCNGWSHGPEYPRIAFGSRERAGVLQSQMFLPASAVAKFPEFLTDQEASTLACAGVTAWDALTNHGQLQAGQTVLVQGTGGISTFAIMFAKTLGAHVIVVSNNADHNSKAQGLGADHVIEMDPAGCSSAQFVNGPGQGVVPGAPSDGQWGAVAKQITGGKGVDLVIEYAGNLTQSMIAVRNNGKIVNVGVPNHLQNLDMEMMFAKTLTVTAMMPGNRDSYVAMCNFIATHGLRPVVDRVFEFQHAKEAFQAMGTCFGKLCIHVNDMPDLVRKAPVDVNVWPVKKEGEVAGNK
jgi:NADPH:quinone reductase-like Zn-dependent oxidoreductase